MMSREKKGRDDTDWFRLDNAAKIYPAVIGGDFTAVFRISAILMEDIVYSALADAITVAATRFPYFNVTLSNGLFWYYLEKVDTKPRLYPDEPEICTAFPIGSKREVMYRIIVKEKTISVEFVHIITDGGGALEFLKTLLYEYFRNLSKIDVLPSGICDPSVEPDPEEYEDSFSKYFNKRIPATENPKPALHLPFRLNNRPRFRTMVAEIDSGEINARAKELNVSVTEYLVAVYLAVLQDLFYKLPERKRRGVIRVQVPVNLRRLYGSRTLRNFSLFVVPELDLRLGMFAFSDILDTVHHMVRLETHPLRISRIIRRNVGGEKLFIIRVIPVIIKRLILAIFYYTFGSGLCTGVLTNMGRIDIPPEIGKYIDCVAITPPPPNKKVKVSCGVASFGSKMRITFGSIAEEQNLEKGFLRFLLKEGIGVRIL